MRFLCFAICAACSGSNFDILVAGDSAADQDSGESITDSATKEVAVSDGQPMDAGCVDETPPPAPCTVANSDLAAQIDVPSDENVATLDVRKQIGFHMRMPRAGRVGKITVRMIPAPGTGTAGTFMLQAFTSACSPRLLATARASGSTAAAMSPTFDFSTPETAMPVMGAREALNFVLTTDSEEWSFVLRGANTPSPNTNELFFGTRASVGDFMRVDGKMLSVKVFTYACD